MKKISCIVLLLVAGIGFSQEKEFPIDFKKNELKGNALLFIFGSFDVAYERILNEESGVGMSINIPFDKDNWDSKYSATGFCRYYFGQKPAAGFFGEVFGMLNNVEDTVYNEDLMEYEDKTLTDFALGIGIGGKWVTKKGLLLEISTGVGRNLFNNQYDDRDHEVIGRIGVMIGSRY